MSVYLTFDKASNCSDGALGIVLPAAPELIFPQVNGSKSKKNLGYVCEEIGWWFGINSGVSFTKPKNPFAR